MKTPKQRTAPAGFIMPVLIALLIAAAVTFTACGQKETDDRQPSPGLAYTVNSDGRTCTVTGIGECTDTELIIPGQIGEYTVTSLGTFAFSEQAQLRSVSVPASVREIGGWAFNGCKGLTDVRLDGAVSIGECAFRGCGALERISLPASLSRVGNYAFSDCTALREVHISDLAAWCGVSFRNEYAVPLRTGAQLFVNGEAVTILTVPDGVREIRAWAFAGCSGLTDLILPDGLETVDTSAFCRCSGLRTVTFGKGLSTVGETAFEDCTALERLSVPSLDDWCKIRFEGYAANPLLYAKHLYLGGQPVTSLTVPDGTEVIGDYQFADCEGLTQLTVPASVTSIGKFVLIRCRQLTTLTYRGTVAEWQAIAKEKHYLFGSAVTSVVCSDGTVDVSNEN